MIVYSPRQAERGWFPCPDDMPAPLHALLIQRGVQSVEEAKRFLHPTVDQLRDPMLLHDMDRAVQRIRAAIAAGERICVYGDYDVDGVSASALLSDYLRSHGAPDTEVYLPSRHTEGYGLNENAVREIAERCSLMITVDCGITAVDMVALAKSLGLDCVVTDHHEPGEVLPDCPVVDPLLGDYPFPYLCGAGVAFKLVCAMDGDADKMLARYGDLVAVGTVADVMPLLGENRFITRCGLQKIAAGDCRPGFLALAEEAGVRDKPFTASTVGFSLAPRINAAGRLGEPGLAVRLLEETDLRRARVLAAELCAKNRERQALEMEIWREAVERLHGEQPDAPIVLASEGWHPGVIGIVASRLTDAYSVPAVMICLDGESGKGSCRSTGSFNLFEALSACSDCLEGFGGHAMAAGVTVRRGCVDELRSRLREYYLSHPDRTLPALEADLLVDSPELLTMACVESLDELEPCGNGNPRPLLYMENVSLDSVQPIGGGKHLRLKLAKFGQTYDGVFFSQTVPALGARAGQRCDIVFAPQINEFHGRRSVQLVITDLRRSKEG